MPDVTIRLLLYFVLWLLAGLLFEIDALVLLVMFVGFVAHEATTLWDLRYASGLREITPVEQHVHSFLEVIPLMAIVLVLTLAWPQFLALFGLGPERARFDLRIRVDPVPVGYVVTLLAAALLFNLLPFVEELVRGLRANGGRIVPARAGRH